MNQEDESHTITRRGFGQLTAALLAASSTGSIAQESAYPTKPIKLLIPSPAGSMYDSVGRVCAVEVEKKLGQPVILDFKSGAGGTPAFVQTKNSAPDGYTLVISGLSTIRQPILDNVGYEGVKDFTWIAGLAGINFAVMVPTDSPFKTWADLLAFGKAHPDKISYGAPSGLGNSAHMFTAEIASREKVDWTPVPYRASNDCIVALLSNQITFSTDTIIGALGYIQAGKVRLLAMATDARVSNWPNIPTMRDLGYPISINSQFGISGPAKMQPGVVRKIQDAFLFATEQPSFISLMERAGQKPQYLNTADFTQFAIKAQVEQRALLTKYGFAKKA
jgi:tripartite-type tricarboxylate transporter receptor subunit TctC